MLSLHCCHCCRRCNRRHIVCICIDDVVVTNNANDCVCSDNELGCLLLFLFFCLLLLAVVELTTTSLQHCVIIAVVALHVFAMMMWLSQTMQRIALTVSMSLVVCSAIFLVVFCGSKLTCTGAMQTLPWWATRTLPWQKKATCDFAALDSTLLKSVANFAALN